MSDSTRQSVRTAPGIPGRFTSNLEKSPDLSKKYYVSWWVDAVYVNAHLDDTQCLLIFMGATKHGKQGLMTVEDGYRESEQSWSELLEDLKGGGPTEDPKLDTGDGAPGFRKALARAYPATKRQRCWFHKTGNVPNKMPRSKHDNVRGREATGGQNVSLPVTNQRIDDGVSTRPCC